MRAGKPVASVRASSCVDGIGSTRVLDDMWPLLSEVVDDVVTTSVEEAEQGVRLAARQSHLIVEGAAGVCLAAALSQSARGGRVIAVLSGGNIDHRQLCRILQGDDAQLTSYTKR